MTGVTAGGRTYTSKSSVVRTPTEECVLASCNLLLRPLHPASFLAGPRWCQLNWANRPCQPPCHAPTPCMPATLCRQALIHTAEPKSHTSATIELTPPATNVAVQKYICVVCLLRQNASRAAAPSAVVAPASGFTCPFGRQPIVKECPTTSCTVAGLGAGKSCGVRSSVGLQCGCRMSAAGATACA